MVKLKANFEADGIAHLRGQLVDEWGRAEIDGLDDRDVRFYYFESRRRKIAPLQES